MMLKRIVSLTLAVSMVLTSVPFGMPMKANAATDSSVLYGDMNADGKIDLKDDLMLAKYLKGQSPVGFQAKNGDVDGNNFVNEADLQVLRKYLAEWDMKLGPEILTVSFYDGDRLIDTLVAEENDPLGEVPSVGKSSKENAVLLGYYTDKEFTKPFYAENPVTEDMKVYAKYQELGSTEELNITSFAQMDQTPDVSFEIVPAEGAVAPEAAVELIVKDGSDAITVTVTDEDGDGVYTVKAPNGFGEGCSYELVLAEGWTFKDKEETIRTAAFSIDMEEVENLEMSDGIIYIKDTDEIGYDIEDEEYEVLTSDLLTEDGGSFNFKDADELTEGDIICVYVGTHPEERSTDNGSEMLDPAVYVKVSDIDGDEVSFVPLGVEDQQKLYDIPNNFPILVGEMPTEGAGYVYLQDLDLDLFAEIYGEDGTLDYAEELIGIGDFVSLYVSQERVVSDNEVYYGEIIDYDAENGKITYIETTEQAITESMDLYAEVDITGEDLITDEEKEALEEELQAQVEASDFGEEAAYLLADLITKTDGFRNNAGVQDILLTDKDGNPLSEEEIQLLNIGAGFELSDDIELKVELITKGDQLHFGDGVQLAIGVEAEFEVEVEDGDKIVIKLVGTFVQEVAIDPRVKGSVVHKKILVKIPIGVKVDATVDIKSYTALSFEAEIYTVAAEDKSIWEKVKDIANDPTEILGLPGIPEELKDGLETMADVMDKIEELDSKIDKATDTVETIQGYQEDVAALWAFVEENGLTTKEDWKQMEETLEKTSVASDLLGLMDMTTETELSTEYLDSMQALMDKYSEMLEKETDWVKLVDQEILTVEVCYFGIAVGVEASFVVRADMSIAIGSNLEYEVGKRYNMWFKVGLFKPSSGSSTMDLIDERFAFQFYVMGKLGVKAGIKAKVYAGIGSGKFASIGLTAELGPYIKLYGFFVYEYTKYRPANTKEWTSKERMAGALFMEFGVYFILGFEANAIGDLFEYSHDFVDEEIPLLKAGTKRFFYANAYEPEEDENLRILDEDNNSTTGITMQLPDSMLALSYVDLQSGIQGSESLGYDKYNFTLSNPNFTFDKATGKINVTVPENTRYMECDLTITYLYGKMAFSQYDMSVTIPLVWTNLSDAELSEYYTASVRVGNDEDGYQTVWTKKVLKNQAYDLPTEEEIKELIGWSDAKYVAGTGYGDQQTTGLTLIEDEVYDYHVDYQTYSLTVEGIQKEDGSTYSETYYAKYGEAFDLSALAETGTCKVGEEYTKFASITTDATIVVNGKEEVIDLSRPINAKMAATLAEGVVATANYIDNGVTITFIFDGIDHEDVEMKVCRGEEPDLTEIEEIVSYEGLAIADISPMFGKVYTATTYEVTCGELTGPEATISFEENGGTTVSDITKVVGSLVGNLPTSERTGYTFGGWYTDNGTFEVAFDERKVPENGVVLYAKWTANEYTVNFHVNGGNDLAEGEQSMAVTYDDTYGTLPWPTKTGYGFVGWFTEAEGGTQIKDTDIVNITADVTLYAQWKVLKDISDTVFDFGEMESYFYHIDTNREPDYTFTAEDGETYEEGSFTFKYMVQGASDYMEGLPMYAGTYDVLVTRDADNDYAKFEKLYTGVLTIENIYINTSWYRVKVKENTGTGSERSLKVEVYWNDDTVSKKTMEINKAAETAYFEKIGTAPTGFWCKATGGLSRTFHLTVDVYDILGNKKNIGDIDKYWVAAPEYEWNINVPAAGASTENIYVDSDGKIEVNMATYGISGVLGDMEYIVDNEAVTVDGSKLIIDGSKLTGETNTIAVCAQYPGGDVVQIAEFDVAVNTVE